MESIHGVDVSWLHHPHKGLKGMNSTVPQDFIALEMRDPKAYVDHAAAADKDNRKKPTTLATPPPPPRDQRAGQQAFSERTSSLPTSQQALNVAQQSSFPGPVTPPALSRPVRDTTAAVPSTPPVNNTPSKSTPKRPGLLNRSSLEKLSGEGKGLPRRTSWISNISNRFSSTPPLERQTSTPSTPSASSGATQPNGNGAPRAGSTPEDEEEIEPYIPSKPKESSSSFFSNLTRKLSAGTQASSTPKASGKIGMCERMVLNQDPNRERCFVPEMDTSKLRKVSFSVDVEIAGGPRYKDDDDDDEERNRRKKDVKQKERAEGEALKHPETIKEETDDNDKANSEGRSKSLPIHKEMPNNGRQVGDQVNNDGSSPKSSLENAASLEKKREKKKRSEEERKERKEKRRRRAEENGSIPVELSLDDDSPATIDGAMASSLPNKEPSTSHSTRAGPPVNSKRARPTTDPVRIYRRCCQLRETPILKRITEQLMSPTCCPPFEPGVVACLDLTGSRLQLADMVTLGDWLAVVPVKRLLLEDADLSDEGLRCILAGLLAAKHPEPSRRQSTTPKHREPVQTKLFRERSGYIEKLTLKNNSRITRLGWKHISLFLYMCKSIRAIDLSMVQFPDTLPPSVHSTPVKGPQNAPQGSSQGVDAAETFFQCLSQRPGGNKLEELIVSECGLKAPQIRKIVDGAIICGTNRIGFAGNHLDDEGLECCLHYLKSGVSGGLDLGGNDLRGKLGMIADALNNRAGVSCWGLSLAGCNLDTASVKALFPALVKLPNFRFIDFSHNPDLCGKDNGTISLLRRYIGQMKYLKRIHLADVGMSSKQAIALADVLPEGPELAHLNILENPQLSALAHAKDEASQEEACALYASYMAAVRVSNTLICIDIDVPSPDTSEIVKALAKQVVAYSLRNMERFAMVETTGIGGPATVDAAASLAEPHGGEQQLKEIAVPDVLMHLVGHIEGNSENHDNDEPAPDEDYIVGGTGVVKALQYVLGEKADDMRRSSVPGTPTLSGLKSVNQRPNSSAGLNKQQQLKAKKMSKNLLDSARKIRSRLQPALAKEASASDEINYRRLNFLDQTLQSMIQRFEEEYPETRLEASSIGRSQSGSEHPTPLSLKTQGSEVANRSDDEDEYDDFGGNFRPTASRHNSDVSLASRALSMEEGHLHRIGQRMRREVVDSPSTALAPGSDPATWKTADEAARLASLKDKIEGFSGPELKTMVEKNGWDSALTKVGANMSDLRQLQELDPQGWNDFLESQMKARMNVAQDARGTS